MPHPAIQGTIGERPRGDSGRAREALRDAGGSPGDPIRANAHRAGLRIIDIIRSSIRRLCRHSYSFQYWHDAMNGNPNILNTPFFSVFIIITLGAFFSLRNEPLCAVICSAVTGALLALLLRSRDARPPGFRKVVTPVISTPGGLRT
jgi:hypothetical protein